MLRFIGILLLMGLVLYLCLLHSRREERRVRECEGFLLLVRHIRAEIASFRAPLPEALASFDNAPLSASGFLAAARENGLGAALSLYEGRLFLDTEEGKTLAAFADGVGKGFCEEALALCDYTAKELEGALARRKREAPGRSRIGHSLLVCGALMLLLLFV